MNQLAIRMGWSRIWMSLLIASLVLLSPAPLIAGSMPSVALAISSDATSQAFPNPGACTRLFRAWRKGYEDDPKMDVCLSLMGINQYCAAHDSFVAVGYDRDQTYRYLVCAPYSHPDSIGDQFVHIVKGLGEGAADAFVAAVPFVGAAVSGVACVYGQVYACAVLALEISDAAGVPVTGVAGEAFAIAADVGKCTDGDVVACAKVGVHGATAAGLIIPGKDAAQVASDAQLCDQGDFAACMRLGKAASDAGGVPQGLGNGSVVNAEDCLAGNAQACTLLGREAASASAPMGGVAGGANDLQACENGDTERCTHLGKSLAALTRAPQTGIALGRVQSTTPTPPPVRLGNEPMICARARDARARNSPMAPALTAQCEAVGGDFTERKVMQLPNTSAPDQQAMKAKMIMAPDPPICARARDARARNSPAAPQLEAACRAAGGH